MFLQILVDRHSWTSNSWYYLIDLKLLHAVPRWKIQSLHYITIICPIPDTQIQRFCCCANSEKPNKSFSVNFHWMWILTQLKLSHISSVVEWDIGIAFGPNNVFKYFSQNNFAAEILVFLLPSLIPWLKMFLYSVESTLLWLKFATICASPYLG